MNLSTIIFVSIMVVLIEAGAVGECRSECVEQNRYKIVRVHLKDDLVMVGVCGNTTTDSGSSTVIPYVCHRNIGVWTFDIADEEGIAAFPVRCPPNSPVPGEQLLACPKAKPFLA